MFESATSKIGYALLATFLVVIFLVKLFKKKPEIKLLHFTPASSKKLKELLPPAELTMIEDMSWSFKFADFSMAKYWSGSNHSLFGVNNFEWIFVFLLVFIMKLPDPLDMICIFAFWINYEKIEGLVVKSFYKKSLSLPLSIKIYKFSPDATQNYSIQQCELIESLISHAPDLFRKATITLTSDFLLVEIKGLLNQDLAQRLVNETEVLSNQVQRNLEKITNLF